MENYNKLMLNLAKMNEKYNNSIRGHEPKCKICNSEYQKEVEIMYESKHSYREIKEFLESNNELVSQMALSRHFNNHYPKRKAYFENIKKLEDESIVKAIESYPDLKTIFQESISEPDYDNMVLNDDQTGFKEFLWKEKTLSDVFLNDKGYCLTDYRFCDNIPKKEVQYMEDIVSDFNVELMKLDDYSFNESKKIDLLYKKIKCLECRDSIKSITIEYVIYLLFKNFYHIELESDKLNELFNELLANADYDFKELDKLLTEI